MQVKDIKEGTFCNEHWVLLYVSNELLNSTAETMLHYIN